MGFNRSTTDISVHQKLSDEPNIDDGLSAGQLKKRLDYPAEQLQQDLNNLMAELEDITGASNIGAEKIEENDTSDSNLQAKLIKIYKDLQSVVLGQIPNGVITAEKMNEDYANRLVKDMTVKSGTITGGGVIPQTEGYKNYFYIVSINNFASATLMNTGSNAFVHGFRCFVNQNTRVVTAKRMWYIGSASSYQGETNEENISANYYEFAWN